MATTENSVYATLNNPTLNNPGQYLFHTTLHIACQEAAGLSDAENAVEAIYAKLATREISALGQASESFLSYWGAGFARCSLVLKNCFMIKMVNAEHGHLFG
ncbi:MAG: hypothetical protein IPL33_16735 [Sphingobacteriales bacterium]|nr:hypothetical protein [Sphingobacteriales bacterium]